MKLSQSMLVLVLPLLAGCADQQNAANQQKASEEIDFGTVEGSVYRNKYFRMTVTLPEDWSIQDEESKQEMMKLGTEVIAGDDKNLKAAVKASELTSVNLLSAFQHPVGSPVPSNPSFICVAERVRHLPGIKTGQDYLTQAKKLLQSSQVQANFPNPMSTQIIGGHEFGVLDIEMSLGFQTVRQKSYAMIQKGYALCFVLSFGTEEESAMLQDILNTVTIE